MKPRRNTQREGRRNGRVYRAECSRPHVYTRPRCLKRPHDYTCKGTTFPWTKGEKGKERADACANMCVCVCARARLRNLSGRDQKVPESGVSGDEVV